MRRELGELRPWRRVSLFKEIVSSPDSELTALLPHLYSLLPLPAASSAIAEILSESIFKFGKGTKVLTEPLVGWFVGPSGQAVLSSVEGGECGTETLGF